MNDESPFHKFDYLESNVILVILGCITKILACQAFSVESVFSFCLCSLISFIMCYTFHVRLFYSEVVLIMSILKWHLLLRNRHCKELIGGKDNC